ncbi:glycoside hydrolase family 9 protein [Rapidithrix thailandica]|uniref:Glycoside hydrolase family 9 protein n=1 Tax=Rapidithrix thailandica TaxID=413964 RepID=A0AAW9S1K7_9BACT
MKRLFTVLGLLLITQWALGQSAKILFNHLGYEPEGPKKALIQGGAHQQFTSFQLLTYPEGKMILKGTPEAKGPVEKWKAWHYWSLEFSQVEEEGEYIIAAQSGGVEVRSLPFMIQKELLERKTMSDVLYYFKGQRSSGQLDKADRNMRFEGNEDQRVDVHGGWFDATGDYGKHLSHLSFSTYFNPQQIPLVVWSLFKTYENLTTRNNPSFRQYLRRALDEGMYGADYLVRVKRPQGSFYRSVSGRGAEKKAEDRIIPPVMTGFKIKEKPPVANGKEEGQPYENNETYEVSYRAGAGLSIASLALASTYPVSGEFDNRRYLQVAEEAFAYLEENNVKLTNDGKENIVDDYCALMAATELYKATKDLVYLQAAKKRAKRLLARQSGDKAYQGYWRADEGNRPFFHAADAGMPVVSLLSYLEIVNENEKEEILLAVRKSLEHELAITSEVTNPFGYSRQYVQNKAGERWASFFYPHDAETAPWWQGENARLSSMASAAKMAAPHFRKDPEFYTRLQVFAWDQLSWILGRNPYDCCMLEGSGYNNPQYIFFGSYEYTNAPGGICNGITGGYYDRNDIDFMLPYSETQKDNDWRWVEQWLPHASWYLLAVSLPK